MGRDILLTFQKNIGPALKKACGQNSGNMHLARAAEKCLRLPKGCCTTLADRNNHARERVNRLSTPQPMQGDPSSLAAVNQESRVG